MTEDRVPTLPPPPDWLPEPNERAPHGFEWVADDSDNLSWSLDSPQIEEGRRCRYTESGRRCDNEAKVLLYRGNNRTLPWAYCFEHMYGRWIEDGKVMSWRLRQREAGR